MRIDRGNPEAGFLWIGLAALVAALCVLGEGFSHGGTWTMTVTALAAGLTIAAVGSLGIAVSLAGGRA